jgi:hypothetical protein
MCCPTDEEEQIKKQQQFTLQGKQETQVQASKRPIG